MKPRVSNQTTSALTMMEVFVVIVVLLVLAALLLYTRSYRPDMDLRRESQQINCINNLKQIGLAYRVWEGNHGDKYPMQTSVTNGGTMELENGRNAWINYSVMSNELSTPKILFCPADTDKMAATNFTTDCNNSKISYFVGLDAEDTNPFMFLSGDDNFAIGGAPVKSELLQLSPNTPISWTASRHHFSGEIVFTDGSVQPSSNSDLTNCLQKTGVATNRLAIP
jgi:type II secretory pathway pseudopilin PulG